MLNILMPLGGKSTFYEESTFKFPKVLIEIESKPMIEYVINNIKTINEPLKFIFVINHEDKEEYHLDDVLRLLTDYTCEVITLHGNTKGACCSSLMAIDYIDNDEELILCNGDQLIYEDLNDIVRFFRDNQADAGIACFDAVHPRYAFVRIKNDRVIETAEKRPISKHAIAGLYYYKKGSEYVSSAMKTIEKEANVKGIYYIAPVLNEMVLKNKEIFAYPINSEKYYTFNVPEKIKRFKPIKED